MLTCASLLSGDDMELDSDVEIIREETDSAHFLVASDRQANVRARPPDKMAAGK